MRIQIEVEAYCHECPYFNAATKSASLFADGEAVETFNTVVCADDARCKRLLAYLKQVATPEDGAI